MRKRPVAEKTLSQRHRPTLAGDWCFNLRREAGPKTHFEGLSTVHLHQKSHRCLSLVLESRSCIIIHGAQFSSLNVILVILVSRPFFPISSAVF